MDSRGKSGWGLPVMLVLAVAVYYLSNLKVTPDPEERRAAVQRRLSDGVSPRTLLKEGFSPAELLGAGVTRDALRAIPAVTPSTSPSLTPRETFSARTPSSPGLFSWVYDSLVAASDTMQVASNALTGGLRGSSNSTTLSEGRESAHGGRSHAATAPSTPPRRPRSESPAHDSLRSSARLTPHRESSLAQQDFFDCKSPERSSTTRAPAAVMLARVAALSTAVARGYVEESAAYRYPLEELRFLHADGSRLSIMAECTSAVESDAATTTTTDAYVAHSLARARAAAESAGAYFKVKLLTPARNIATTVMDSYVNAHAGPTPVIIAGFFLVRGDTAYTMQLQTHPDTYEERLSDLLYMAQSARLQEAVSSEGGGCWRRRRGRTEYRVRADGVDQVYVVEAPVDVVVRAPPAQPHARSELTLSPSRCADAAKAPWEATVRIRAHVARDASEHRGDGVTELLRDTQVVIELTVRTAGGLETESPLPPTALPPPLATVLARAVDDNDAGLADNVYRSADVAMPLPPPECFHTVVCEHPYEPSVTLLLATAPTADLFEMELRIQSSMNEAALDRLFACVESLLLDPAPPHRATNVAGQACFSVAGLAVSPAETMLSLHGLQLSGEQWLLVRWLYAASAVVPRELERYRRDLVAAVVR